MAGRGQAEPENSQTILNVCLVETKGHKIGDAEETPTCYTNSENHLRDFCLEELKEIGVKKTSESTINHSSRNNSSPRAWSWKQVSKHKTIVEDIKKQKSCKRRKTSKTGVNPNKKENKCHNSVA